MTSASGGQRVGKQTTEDRVEGVRLELQRRRHTEVPAPAAQRPEEIRLVLRIDEPHLAVGGDDLDLREVVDGQPVRAHQPAESPAERQAGDTGRRHDAARRRLPVDVGRPVVLVPRDAALDPCSPATGVDVDPAHQREVDHQPALGDRTSGDVVATAADGDLEPGVAPEVHRVPHVGDVETAGDRPGMLVDEPVVHRSRGVVLGISRKHEHAVEGAQQLLRDHDLDHGCLLSPAQVALPRER